jgi:uncharacterized glyoxalase superfamily protein PhnB
MSEPTRTPMTEDRSVTSSVEVPVDADTAFAVFTEELDLWWVRGPINHHAGGRVLAMRCEPGVGGRLLEVYDDATGEALELARITAWEPGKRLAWQSSIDDVETEVRFEGSAQGTAVTVVARIPAAGSDRGGTSWVRVVPNWYGAWCATRDQRVHQVRDIARLALGVYYRKPAAGARWLAQAFGFEPTSPLPAGPDPLPAGDHGHPWIEFRVGDSSLMVFPLDDDAPETPPTHVAWVYVDHIEDHLRRSVANGATIVSGLDSPWGLPFYVVDDPEGRGWTFAQARPTMRSE